MKTLLKSSCFHASATIGIQLLGQEIAAHPFLTSVLLTSGTVVMNNIKVSDSPSLFINRRVTFPPFAMLNLSQLMSELHRCTQDNVTYQQHNFTRIDHLELLNFFFFNIRCLLSILAFLES